LKAIVAKKFLIFGIGKTRKAFGGEKDR